MGRPVLCQSCLYCGECSTGTNTRVVRTHAIRKHKDKDLTGVSATGRCWRRLNADYPHIFVSLSWEHAGNAGANVGLCSLCGEHWHPAPGGHFPRSGAEAWFATHTCHEKQVRTYKAPQTPVGGAAMATKATPRGPILTPEYLEALQKKFPGFTLEYDDSGDDWVVDVMATVESAARDAARLAQVEKAARKAPAAVSGDFHSAALRSLMETTSVASHIQLILDSEKRAHESELSDWEEEDEHEEGATAPDPANIPRNALVTLVQRSLKLEAAQANTKAAVARALAPLEAELSAATVRNSGLLAQAMAQESNNRSLLREVTALTEELNRVRALVAEKKSED